MSPIGFSHSSLKEGRWYEYLIRFALGALAMLSFAIFFSETLERSIPGRLPRRVARLVGRLGGGLVRAPQDAVGPEEAERWQNQRPRELPRALRGKRGVRPQTKPSR